MKIFSKNFLVQPPKKYFKGNAKILAVLTYRTSGSSTSKYLTVGSEDAVTWYPIKSLEKITSPITIKTVMNTNAFVYKDKILQEFKYSFDGVNWKDVGIPAGVDLSNFYTTSYAINYFNGYYYFILGKPSNVFKSTDLQNWQAVTYTYSDGRNVTSFSNSTMPTYGGGYFYCCFSDTKSALYRSNDGENWTYIIANNRYTHRGTACDSTGFVTAFGYTGSQTFSNVYFKNYSTSYSSYQGDVTRIVVSKKRGLVYIRINGMNKKSTVDAFPTFTDTEFSFSNYSEYFDFFYSENTSEAPSYSKDLVTSTPFDFSSVVSSNMTLTRWSITAL